VLGQKWHFLRKGFPPNKTIQWDSAVWEELYEILRRVAPTGQFLWNNQQVVRMFLPGASEPWASVWTKRPEALTLEIVAPKGAVALGRITSLGYDRELEGSRPECDLVKLRFRRLDDLHETELEQLLSEMRDKMTGELNH
jgi:excinuclease ABC subunit A